MARAIHQTYAIRLANGQFFKWAVGCGSNRLLTFDRKRDAMQWIAKFRADATAVRVKIVPDERAEA